MRNDSIPMSKRIISLVSRMPYFTLSDLSSVERNKTYLKIIFSRYVQQNKLIRLKREIYVTKEFIEEVRKKNIFSDYLEFIANSLYASSYLGMEYVLHEHNILTELPQNFICVSLNKTNSFFNKFGIFFYHKIRKQLFTGFTITNKSGFSILKSTKAKALFDFIYFRKNILVNIKTVEQLRLNLENFNRNDRREFEGYISLEGSKKMKEISNFLF